MQEMEDSMATLEDMLKGLSELKEKLPDRGLNGIVRAIQDLDKQFGTNTTRGQCSAFGLLKLRSHSLETYPLGAWESIGGQVHALVQRDHAWTTLSGTATESWRADDIVEGSFAISSHDDDTYSVSFSTAAIPTSIETRYPKSEVMNTVQGRCDINIDLDNLPLPQDEATPFAGSGVDTETKTRVSWEFWPNKCKADEFNFSKSADYGSIVQEGFDGEVQAAFVNAFRSQGVAAGPEHVTVFDTDKENPFTFIIRVSKDHCVLPHRRAIARECIKLGSQEGAMHAFIGGIQRTSHRTRATIRVVNVETGVVESTGKGDTDGTNSQAIEQAVEKALDAMDYKITCAKGVTR